MADKIVSQEIDLEEFLASAAHSFTDAQRSLLQGSGVSANMMLSTAELELKVSVSAGVKGRMAIRPVSFQDISRENINPAMLSTLRINLISSVGELADEAAPSSKPPENPGGRQVRIPDLTGLTLDKAAACLKAGKWKFQTHAAPRAEAAKAGIETHGKVLRQEPLATSPGDKTTETVHFWVNLGSVPVKMIDGIGEKMELSLSKIGIRSVGELSLANVDELSSSLHLNTARTQDLVDMAGLMANLTVLGLKDEVVELLVKGVRIPSLKKLAAANPKELYQTCLKAISSKKIQTPRKFSFTQEHVAAWVQAAKDATS